MKLARDAQEEIIEELVAENVDYEIGKIIDKLISEQDKGKPRITAMELIETAWSTS